MKNENNLDLLRLTLAFTVYLVCAHSLPGNSALATHAAWPSSEHAVEGLFVISGHLVYLTYVNSRETADYLQKHTQRIYSICPTAFILCAAFGASATIDSLTEYLRSGQLLYFATGVALNQLHMMLPRLRVALLHPLLIFGSLIIQRCVQLSGRQRWILPPSTELSCTVSFCETLAAKIQPNI